MNTQYQNTTHEARVSIDRSGGDVLTLSLSGSWKLDQGVPSADAALKEIESGQPVRSVALDVTGMSGWDSGLLTFLIKIFETCSKAKIEVDKEGLPEGVRRLINLATAVPERKGARKEAKKEAFLSMVGGKAVAFYRSFLEMLDFLGESSLAFTRLLRGKASFRRSDLWLLLQECGGQALPIVSLITLLVGLILAFVGAIQLKLFGAQVYVADIVAIAMVRVMGAIMTGIIVAGRTGAAFAAQIGTMQVNEEIDALKTMGISPVEFLVLPEDDRPDHHDAFALHLRGSHGYRGGNDRGRGHARHQPHRVPEPDPGDPYADHVLDRAFPQRCVRGAGGSVRVPSGHAVRQERF